MAESGYTEQYLVGLNFMAHILHLAPDEEFLGQMRHFQDVLFDWPGVDAKAAKALQETCNTDITALIPDLAEDHARLFSGPSPLAPPWESVWREREKLLFGQCTAEIASLYEDWGLASASGEREPADHLGLELAFLAYLLDAAHNQVQSASGQNYLQCARELLEQHIMQFAPQVLERGAKEAKSSFYRQACQNCLLILRELKTVLAGA